MQISCNKCLSQLCLYFLSLHMDMDPRRRVYFSFLLWGGMEARAWCMRGKHSVVELHPVIMFSNPERRSETTQKAEDRGPQCVLHQWEGKLSPCLRGRDWQPF